MEGSENIFDGMTKDLPRSYFTINGQTFTKDAETDHQAIYAAFKKALPAEKAQKAVSSIMHQGGLGDLTVTMMKCPTMAENPVELFNLPGGKLLFQRDMSADRGVFFKPLFDGNQAAHFDLQVSPDGNTAVVEMRIESDLLMGGLEDEGDSFGGIRLAQKLTIDLRPDVPVVTDVKLSQSVYL